MSDNLNLLTKSIERNPGISLKKIQEIECELGVSFPHQYKDWLTLSNGAEGFIGKNEYLVLWPVEKLKTFNAGYAVEEFAPGLLLFGSNGGTTAYAFDSRVDDMPIVKVPFIGMSLEEMVVIGRTFNEFMHFLYDR
jgi:hypothetical protein